MTIGVLVLETASPVGGTSPHLDDDRFFGDVLDATRRFLEDLPGH